jgi:hypothetical protein
MPEPALKFTGVIEGPCPCGGTWTAGYAGAEKVPGVLHSLPPCEDFMRVDGPTDFLAFVRHHLQEQKVS